MVPVCWPLQKVKQIAVAIYIELCIRKRRSACTVRILGAARNTGPCMVTQQLSTNKCFQGTDLQRQLLKVLMLAG